MPELPEVETIRRGLQNKIVGKKIAGVVVKKSKLAKNPLPGFKKTLVGSSFNKIERRGKLLIFGLSKITPGVLPFKKRQAQRKTTPGVEHRVLYQEQQEKYLLVHLKMTGQLVYLNKKQITAGGHSWPKINKLPNKYSHIIFTFSDGSKLFFNDQRQFGYMQIVNQADKNIVLKKFGIEPLTPGFTWQNFQNIFNTGCYKTKRKTAIKNLLLNQSLVAGLGNIYADEVCYRAKIKPQKKANKLTVNDQKNLYTAIPYVLKKAIDFGGTTFSNYRDADGRKGNFSDRLMVYQRSGQPCRRCQQIIKKIKLGGRGTHYCPQCQK